MPYSVVSMGFFYNNYMNRNITTTNVMKGLAILTLVLLSQMVFAQKRSVSGKIVSGSDGMTLPGVTVQIKGTTTGTVTDIDGNYKLSLDSDDEVLVFSYIGFKPEVINVNGRTVIDVTLQEDIETLEEIVVVGYGSQSKALITGNISSVTADELTQTSQNNFQNALQGLAPGVSVDGASGALGGASFIRIRGVGSLGSNSDPLYVIDGVPMSAYPSDGLGNFGTVANPMASIDPNDIESIQVLKDAQAGSIYGSRAANGVILVTTKTGKAQKTKYNVSYNFGLASPTHIVEMLNTPQYLSMLDEAWDNSNVPEEMRILPRLNPSQGYTDEVARNTNNDQYENVYRVGKAHNFSFSANGGTDKMQLSLQASYVNQEGIMNRNDFERFSARANFDYKPNSKISLGVKSNVTTSKVTQFPTNIYFLQGRNGSPFQFFSNPVGLQFIRFGLPMYPETNPFDGTYFQGQYLTNTAPTLDPDYFQDNMENLRLINSFNFDYKILPTLTFKTQFSLNFLGQSGNTFFSPLSTTEALTPDCVKCYGYADQESILNMTTTAFSTLDYSKEFNKHSIELLVGVEQNLQRNNKTTIKAIGIPPTNAQKGVKAASTPIDWDNTRNGSLFRSAFFRSNYSYNQKYLASFSIRTDGSSRFGAQNRWGTFPAGSAGWIISEESFLKSNSVINFLKIRASYGVIGNAEIDQNAAFANWNLNANSYAGGYGLSPKRLSQSTENLRWEQASIFDIGINYSLFNSRVTGEIGFYDKVNNQLLAKISAPPSAGIADFIQNSGSIRNRGVEFGINAQIIDKAFKWNANFNIAYNENEVLRLAVAPEQFSVRDGLGQPVLGGPVASYRLVKWLGVDPQTGYEMFEDPATGKPFEFEDPARPTKEEMIGLRQIIKGKSGIPKFVGGFSTGVSYKGIALDMNVTFKLGNYIYDQELNTLAYLKQGNALNNFPLFLYEERWQKPGDQTDVPRLEYDHPLGAGNPSTDRSTRFLYDASYARLRNVTLSYTLPKSMTNQAHLSNVRFFVSADNFLTFTKYPGWDPEAVNSIAAFSPAEGNILPGYVSGNPPQSKTLRAGVSVNF